MEYPCPSLCNLTFLHVGSHSAPTPRSQPLGCANWSIKVSISVRISLAEEHTFPLHCHHLSSLLLCIYFRGLCFNTYIQHPTVTYNMPSNATADNAFKLVKAEPVAQHDHEHETAWRTCGKASRRAKGVVTIDRHNPNIRPVRSVAVPSSCRASLTPLSRFLASSAPLVSARAEPSGSLQAKTVRFVVPSAEETSRSTELFGDARLPTCSDTRTVAASFW